MGNTNHIKGNQQVMVATKEAVTEAQLLPILGVIQTLAPLLVNPHTDADYTMKHDGGAKAAVGVTIINACARLDAILGDASRYDFSDTKKFFDTLQKSQEAQLEFLTAQRLASEEVLRPSFQLRPTVGVYENGYIAFWGDVSKPGGAIVGVGATPAEALLDFDKSFNRTPAENLMVIGNLTDEPEPQPEDAAEVETPEQFTKKQKKGKKGK